MIRDIMDLAVADNLNMLRTFAFATNALYPMQTSPGVYNEAVFQGLDYVLDQARQRGIKVRADGDYINSSNLYDPIRYL